MEYGMENDRYAKCYENRELSWLEFNFRILGEAKDKNIPLFERLKFLSITASNLDEFFMVRIASLKDMIDGGYNKKDIAGLKPCEQLEKIYERTHEFTKAQYNTLNRSLLPALEMKGLRILDGHEQLNKEQQEYVDHFFEKEVYPVLTPMAVDSSRPFPLIRNKTLNIAALIKKKDGKGDLEFATVQVPSVLPRIVKIPDSEGISVILLEEIIERNIASLFLNYDLICAYPYRIMRNSDFVIDEEETEDLLKEIQKQIKKRQWGAALKLEVEDKIDKRLLKILKKNLGIDDSEIYAINGPLDLTFLMKVYGIEGFEDLKVPKYIPAEPFALEEGEDIFARIRKGDILLHHPYESFDVVVDFIRQASEDEDVLAIKQTLYRVSGNSPIIASLERAAENGKQVTVLVELKARFDEENNINWAKKLEKAGCHVIYGLMGLKTHSKITLVVRREEEGIKRYVHLATGNYNDATAKLYTDLGMLTCKDSYGEDATAVFNMISGYSKPLVWNKLCLAPYWLRKRFLYLINRETKNALEGKPAKIIAKMNSLCDAEMIAALYDASCAGVQIELIVRGICCLIPQIPGVSENITVKSIVGNFLEHGRIYYFANNGREELYLSSADMMPRNLDRRVEILFPVEDKSLKAEVMHILEVTLADNVKSYVKKADCTYEREDRRGKTAVNSQETFCKEAKEREKKRKTPVKKQTFTPRKNITS